MRIKMKIGIITLPFNTNYGGMLQAFALYSLLKRYGYDVTIMAKKGDFPLSPFKSYFKFGLLYILGKTTFNPFRHILIHFYFNKVSQFTYQFLEGTTKIKYYTDYAKEVNQYDYDAFIVGSDQVWRPKYFGEDIIDQAFLNFTKSWDVKRISYAASFGTKECEYSEISKELCGKCLHFFDAVSCREDGGLKLCHNMFGVDAVRMIDPTMLLEKEDYVSLCNQNKVPHYQGKLFSYILDNVLSIARIEEAISNELGLNAFHVNAMAENKWIPIQQHISYWLQAFVDAEMIITDSFHGTVLSIIFNKPFWVVVNVDRGSDRFDTLLNIFGLNNRKIETSDISNIDFKEPIDWIRVNHIRSIEKQKALEFLFNSLK